MFATLRKPTRNWRTEITRWSADASGRSQRVQLTGQRFLVVRYELLLGGGCVCNNQETYTQLTEIIRESCRRRQWLVVRYQDQLAG